MLGAERGHRIRWDSQDNCFVGGTCDTVGAQRDLCTIKKPPTGPTIIRKYNGLTNGTEYFADMELDSAGNVYVLGTSEHPSSGPATRDWVLVKYDASLNQQ